MDGSIRLESPRLLEERRRQIPNAGFRWSGSFEYDMSEYEAKGSNQSGRVNDQIKAVTKNDRQTKIGDVNVKEQRVTGKDEEERTKRSSGTGVQPGRPTVGEITPETSYSRDILGGNTCWEPDSDPKGYTFEWSEGTC